MRSPSRDTPLVLLQPRSRLQDILPAFDLPSIDSTYVGIVKDNGALFAMSPSMFPLVVFHDDNSGSGGRSSYPQATESESDDNIGKDLSPWRTISKHECENPNKWTRECLIGVRPVEDSGRSRFNRLLDGVPSVPPLASTGARQQRQGSNSAFSDLDDTDGNLSKPPRFALGIEGPEVKESDRPRVDRRWTLSGVAAAFVACLLGMVYLSRRQNAPSVSSLAGATASNTETSSHNLPVAVDFDIQRTDSGSSLLSLEAVSGDEKTLPDVPLSPPNSDLLTPPTTPFKPPFVSSYSPSLKSPSTLNSFPSPLPMFPKSPAASLTAPSIKSPPLTSSPLKRSDSVVEDGQLLDEEADESEREGDMPGENGVISNGKRRAPRRRKRGKKNKGNTNGNANNINNINNTNGEDEAVDEMEKGGVLRSAGDGLKGEKGWEIVDASTPLPTPGPVVTEVSQSSSLVVSDEVLGMCMLTLFMFIVLTVLQASALTAPSYLKAIYKDAQLL